MADPTTIVQYAQQRSAKLSSALAAAKLQLADAVSTIGTERAKLDAATTDFAALEEKIAAIREKREPNASVAQVLPAMRVLDRLEKSATGT